MSIREDIIEVMKGKKYKPKLKEELAIYFNLGQKEFKDFFNILEGLEREGVVIRTKNEKYVLIDNDYLVVGNIEGNERGFGFLIPKIKERDDIFIPGENMNGAMHGDKVIVNITRRGQGDRREEGEVLKILERNKRAIVGTFEDNQSFGFVVPDDNRIGYDIFIPKSSTLNAKSKQKVVVEITKYPELRRSPEGKVIEILGYLSEKGTDILSVIRQFDLPEEFPDVVQTAAKSASQEVNVEEIKNRVDLRHLNTFTIDGFDAKDLDDAVSIEMKDNGNYYLGIHIADVSHYVRERSPLDKEALNRGNSVYLIDRVIPMLPKELSNGICSLNPGVDRLTLSVLMEIDKNGKVVDHEIVEGVINSKERLVYDSVSEFLEDNDSKVREELSNVSSDLKLMEELCDILYSKREKRGSIDFEFPETKIILDEKGIPLEIRKEDRRIANRLIEEFMLVCNETVAERFFWAELPFLYRIHEEPSPEKMSSFNKLIHNFGYSLRGQEIHPKELQRLTKDIKGTKEETLISTLMLRSLKKAKYSSEADEHFGLAAKYYSHFTAPIRRYPDLMIHRIIKYYLNGKLNKQIIDGLEVRLPEVADHTSMTERRAEEAEREVEDMKKAQYMVKYIGEEFEGIISSLTNFGLFVQLENTIEGLVHFTNMLDDYYNFDEEKYHIIGERTKKIYHLGDAVKIRVLNANPVSRNIDFELI
ncbi:MAG: ribonuclease R [Tissierellaceae bacterium]|nr:ribonuclease R [Tissierellaceae bacterium]